MQYKVTLFSKLMYKEVILSSKMEKLSVGTLVNCDVRLPQHLFFEPFLLEFIYEEQWKVVCHGDIYISSDTVNKFPQANLKHGSSYTVKYSLSDAEFMKLDFLIDFDEKIPKYDMSINIQDKRQVIIGGTPKADIEIISDFIKDTYAVLNIKRNTIYLTDVNTPYGVWVNGMKIEKEVQLRDFDFFSIAYYSFCYKNGKLYTAKENKLRIKELKVRDVAEERDCMGYPKFVRNVREMTELDDSPLTVLEAPDKPQKPKENIMISLMPAVMMIVLTVLLRGSMGGISYLIFSVCSMGMGIVTSIMTLVSNRKQYRKDCEKRTHTYQDYIERKRKEIEEERQKELDLLNAIYIAPEQEKKYVRSFSSHLFDRKIDHDDFISVYLGTGLRKSVRQVDYKRQEKLEADDALAEMPLKVAEDYLTIRNAPITVSLKDNDAVGVVGSEYNCYVMLKNMSYDLAVRHFADDLHLYYVCEEKDIESLHWIRWLPHVKTSQSHINNIVCDANSKSIIFEDLFIQLSNAKVLERDEHPDSYHVIFVLSDSGIMEHPVSQYMKGAKQRGFTFVFFCRESGLLPQYCESVIKLETGGKKGILLRTGNCQEATEFSYQAVSDTEAVRMALKLAPVYCDEISLEGGLVKKYSFYQMLRIFNAEEIDLKKNWSSDMVYRTLRVPLGINAKGEIVFLDLHEDAHGPHGLVAGTTGSGKSEILQSYILSIATRFRPDDVGFVIIDFKGGGMAKQFEKLPHLIGTITDIDGREIDRSLKSIRAELQKRKRLFAENNVNKIDAYIRKYKTGEVSVALPHLIIIVDEFAELKADQPEFMKELISAARIGRSLGVHLILATQKPAGQVDEQIWSNSKFKLCLKVQDKDDSNEVLKSPLAAEIREPGRAYLQVGNNEIFMLFQSAYSGGSIYTDENAGGHEFELAEVNVWGKRSVIFQQKRKKRKAEGKDKKQLEAIVEHISRYCLQNRIERLPGICLPSLEEHIDYPENRQVFAGGCVDIGLYDDPENQIQNRVMLDISIKNTFILGSSQYGKTNMLQSILRTVIENMTSEEANIYIIDFGSKILKSFEDAAQVGGVVCSHEDEKLKNLFKLIEGEIANRKERLASVGVSSFSAYKDAGYTDIPQIYLVVDNLSALIELYLEDDDTLLVFLREGVSVGITVIVGNAQTNGISYKYLSNFANKIVLYCNDSAEYSNIFEHVSIQPKEVPGRCILEIEKRILECQTYLAFVGEKEIDRVEQMKQIVKRRNEENTGRRAKQIPFIPAVLSEELLWETCGADMRKAQIPVGLTYAEVEPFYISIEKMGAFGLCGKERSGHRNFVRYILYQLERQKADYPTEVCIYDDINHKYSDLQRLSIVSKYTLNAEEAVEDISQWYEKLSDRYQLLLDGGSLEKEPLLVMIIQNNDVAKYISDDFTALEKYNEILERFRLLKVCFIYANYENKRLSYDAAEPLTKIKEEQHMIFFDNLSELKVFDPEYEMLKLYRKKMGSGDAYYINGNDITKLKLVLKDSGIVSM